MIADLVQLISHLFKSKLILVIEEAQSISNTQITTVLILENMHLSLETQMQFVILRQLSRRSQKALFAHSRKSTKINWPRQRRQVLRQGRQSSVKKREDLYSWGSLIQ